MLEELKQAFPDREVINAKSIDINWVGVAVKTDFILSIFSERKDKIIVRMCDIGYPYEPDVYSYDNLHDAIVFVKYKINSLLSA